MEFLKAEKEIYDLLSSSNRLKEEQSKYNEDDPNYKYLDEMIAGNQKKLEQVNPDVFDTVVNSFLEGKLFGTQGKLLGGAAYLADKFAGKGAEKPDFQALMDTPNAAYESGKKNHKAASRVAEYGLANWGWDPLSAVTGKIIKEAQGVKDLYRTSKIAKGAEATKNVVPEFVENITKWEDPAKVAQDSIDESQGIVKQGLEGSSEKAKALQNENYVKNLRESGVRSAVSSGLMGLSKINPDDTLENNSMDVIKNTAFGYLLGTSIPIFGKYAGKAIKAVGDNVNLPIGETLSRLPDKMVKKGLAKFLNLSQDDLAKFEPNELGWIRQYIEMANRRGEDVVGGNRSKIIDFLSQYQKEMKHRSNMLIDQSVKEGKSISSEGLENAVKSQFKGDTDKKAVDAVFADIKNTMGPSKMAVHSVPGTIDPISSSEPFRGVEEGVLTGNPNVYDPELGIREVSKYTARDLHEIQMELSKRIDDLYEPGHVIGEEAASKVRAMKKVVEAVSYAYKHLNPEISKNGPAYTLAHAASEQRKALSFIKHLDTGMKKEENKAAYSKLSDYVMQGIGTYGLTQGLNIAKDLSHKTYTNRYAGILDVPGVIPLTSIAGSHLIRKGVEQYRKGMSPQWNFNVGTLLQGHAPTAAVSKIVRPAVGIYQIAREKNKQINPEYDNPGVPNQSVDQFNPFEGMDNYKDALGP